MLDAPTPPPPHPTTNRNPVGSALTALATGIALLVLAGGAAIVIRTSDGPSYPHPDDWDPRVAELAAFVEEVRGRDFDHPVYVDFLDPEDYRAEATAEEGELTDEDRETLARDAGVLRALGVAAGDVDLFEALNAVVDGGTLAFYDTDDRRIRVRGTELTVGLRVTLVHELTHALQDQAFDLTRLYDDDLDRSESEAFRGLVEGDALRIQDEYVTSALGSEEQSTYDDELDREIDAGEAATVGVPPFVTAGFAAPYLLGRPFALMLTNDGGNASVDDALRDPPTTEEHLFDPASFLAGEDGDHLDLGLGDDLEVQDDGPFGVSSWYLVLAERIDPLVAFDAALGWAGDAYAVFERDGTVCIRAAFAGDTREDEDAMTDALASWAEAMPDDVVEPMVVAGHPGFESCDPGPDAEIELTGRARDALNLPSLWGFLVADAITVTDAEGARCYAGTVIDGFGYEDLVDPEGAVFASEAFEQAMLDALRRCT